MRKLAFAKIVCVLLALLVLGGCGSEKPQEKPSKFWQWNMNELADIICVLVGARVSVRKSHG